MGGKGQKEGEKGGGEKEGEGGKKKIPDAEGSDPLPFIFLQNMLTYGRVNTLPKKKEEGKKKGEEGKGKEGKKRRLFEDLIPIFNLRASWRGSKSRGEGGRRKKKKREETAGNSP